MKTYLLKAGVRQAIAKAGETDIAVAYNAKEWMDEYPAGNPQLMVKTPGGKRVPVTVEAVDNLITGQVPNELLAGPGVYSYVFVWTSGSTQLESGRCECLVLGSNLAQDLVHDSRRTPEWAERIFLAAEVIEGAVNGAIEARNVAADKAAEAAESEANAAGSAEDAEDSATLADQKATAAAASAEDAAASAAAMHPENYVAQAFSASTAYSAGTYVMHDGHLYRLTADHDADVTWENTAKVQVKVADDVGDLKSAMFKDDLFFEDRVETSEYQLTWTNGKYINTSGEVGSNNSCSATLDYIPIRKGDVLSIYCHAPGQIDVIAVYDENKTLVEQFTHLKTAGALTYNVASDGFIRMSNEPAQLANSSCFLKVTNLGNINALSTRLTSVETGLGNANDEITEIKSLIPFEYDLEWTSGKYIISGNGTVGTARSMACTQGYYPVKQGQKLQINLYANGTNECAAAFYNESKVYDSTKYETSDGEKIITVPFDGFARFSTKVTYVSTTDAYVKNYVSSGDDEQAGFAKKKYYVKDFDQFITGETVKEFTASSPRIDGTYKGEVNPGKRYLAIGFDDFRASDYSMIIPLFEKYGGRATFNRPITSNDDLTETARNYLDSVIFGNHEVGDHTIKHMAFPYEDALFNGQNPSSPDGSQTPYPTNEQMRGTEGATVNAFYLSVNLKVNYYGIINGLDSTIANTNWKDLTDAQCQTIRETFSALKNPTLAPILDELSNYYLGTTGTSAGSWDSGTGKYTGGIFTGCATSANHEIWERILTIVQMYYKEKCGLNGDIKCWSWPGEYYFGRGFSSNGQAKYYDSNLTNLYSMNARFESSLYEDELGNAKVRSFTDVLREFGYKYTHDYIYPGRFDYQAVPAMRKQFFFNEYLSKEDGVLYPTDRTVTYSAVNTSYPSTFFTTGKTKAAQMYDGGGVFYNFIEALRHDTAHGLIHGEVIDSTDSYSMKIFFEEALRFCKSAGIEVITKAEAYDICFNHPVENGNLIYNPTFRNTAAEFFTDATSVPTNPDGYSGSCSVTTDASGNILVTAGETVYIHYGVPLGKIKYSADAKGTGTITIYLIKCGSAENLSSLTQLAQISVDSASDFVEKTASTVVPNNAMTTWSQRLEGRNNKVMGLKIVYSTGLQIKNIRLVKE